MTLDKASIIDTNLPSEHFLELQVVSLQLLASDKQLLYQEEL